MIFWLNTSILFFNEILLYVNIRFSPNSNSEPKKPQTIICRTQLIPKFDYETIRRFQFDGMLDCLSPEMVIDYLYFEQDLNKISKTYFKMKMDVSDIKKN